MKKVLLGTSAIALAGAFAVPASAAEWNVRVGGYMEQYVAYANSDVKVATLTTNTNGTGTTATTTITGSFTGGDFDGIDSKQDAEIWFIPSITLDNGIKIGANVQLEGFSGGDNIDEAYMFISGSFGEVNLGSENSAGYKMHYAAPDVTFVNVNSGSLTAFIPFSGAGAGADIFRGTLGTTYLENVRNNDAQRFTYYTPRFAGFQVGASYARDGQQDTNAQIDADNPPIANTSGKAVSDIFDIGANYVNSFGDFNVALSGRWGTADGVTGSNPTIWSVGGNLGYAGFTIGGSYADQSGAGTANGHAWDAGISYETGPWGFSFTYFHGENVDNDCGTLCLGNNDEELDQYLVGVSYALAKGVDLNAFGAYVDFEGATLTVDNGSGNTDIDGWVIGTGIKISF